MKKNILKLRFEYFIIFLLIMLSGNPLLVDGGRLEIMLIAATVLCLFYDDLFKKIISSQYLTIFFALFFTIILIQAFEFSLFSFTTLLGLYIRIFLGLVIFFAIPYGIEKYIKCLYFICLISLLTFGLSEILRIGAGVDLKSFFSPLRFLSSTKNIVHIFLYNFDGLGSPHSNSGPFWEPGAFQGYILIAIILLSAYKDRMPSKNYWKMLIIFVLTLLSTKSTTGYLLLPLALISHFTFRTNLRLVSISALKISLIIFVGILLVPKFLALDFIGEKISHQYEEAINKEQGYEINRFGTFISDWQYIKKHPLLGFGIFDQPAQLVNKSVREGQGNGLSLTIYKFGFIGLAIYLIFLFFSFRRFYDGNKIQILVALFVVLLSLNGESFLNFPIYWGLIGLHRT